MEEKDSSREGEGMENKVMKFYSKAGNNIILRAIPGHFATSHSHINYYVDMTGLKTRRSEAAAVGKAFVQRLPIETVVDTIVCLDGCEVIGAYMAEELETKRKSKKGSSLRRTFFFVGYPISSRGAPQKKMDQRKKISHSLPHQVTRMGYTNKTNNKAICHRQPLYMIRDSIYFLFQPE